MLRLHQMTQMADEKLFSRLLCFLLSRLCLVLRMRAVIFHCCYTLASSRIFACFSFLVISNESLSKVTQKSQNNALAHTHWQCVIENNHRGCKSLHCIQKIVQLSLFISYSNSNRHFHFNNLCNFSRFTFFSIQNNQCKTIEMKCFWAISENRIKLSNAKCVFSLSVLQ